MNFASGYVLSRSALRTFSDKVLTNKTLCPSLGELKASEDWNVSLCLAKANVYLGDSRDWLKKARFFVYRPEKNLFGPFDWWVYKRQYYRTDNVQGCCSNYTISFHYIETKNMYTISYLLYRLTPYGFKYRHPRVKQLKFSDIVERLQLELVDASYRGY